MNISKSGIGYSWGVPGYRVTKTAKGTTRTTYSVPGTWLSYVTESSGSKEKNHKQPLQNDECATLNGGDIENSPAEYQDFLDAAETLTKANFAANILLFTFLFAVCGIHIFWISGLAGIVLKIYSHLKKISITYDMDDYTSERYDRLLAKWMKLNDSAALWQVTSSVGIAGTAKKNTWRGQRDN